MHIKSSETLASLKNQVGKVDIENLPKTDTCKNCHLCNHKNSAAGRVSKFVCLFFRQLGS